MSCLLINCDWQHSDLVKELNNHKIKNFNWKFDPRKFKFRNFDELKELILNDFNYDENFNNLIDKNKIWKIFCLHSLKLGLYNKKIKSLSLKNNQDENFNLLCNN